MSLKDNQIEDLNALFGLESTAASTPQEATELKKNKTYSVYIHDPRSNEYAYLQGYYEAKEGETLEDFKTRINGKAADYTFVFDQPVSNRSASNQKIKDLYEESVNLSELLGAETLPTFNPMTLADTPVDPADSSTIQFNLDYFDGKGEACHKEFPNLRALTEHVRQNGHEMDRIEISNSSIAYPGFDL